MFWRVAEKSFSLGKSAGRDLSPFYDIIACLTEKMQVIEASQDVEKYDKINCNLENINFLLYLPDLNENESYVTIWIIHL